MGIVPPSLHAIRAPTRRLHRIEIEMRHLSARLAWPWPRCSLGMVPSCSRRRRQTTAPGFVDLQLTDPVEGGPMPAIVFYPTKSHGRLDAGRPVHHRRDARMLRPRTGAYPLIVHSHGTGGSHLRPSRHARRARPRRLRGGGRRASARQLSRRQRLRHRPAADRPAASHRGPDRRRAGARDRRAAGRPRAHRHGRLLGRADTPRC